MAVAAAARQLAQRTWESKMQQQQDDLDKRETHLANQERKYAMLQAKADELRRREESVKQREDRVSEVEYRCEQLLSVEESTQQMMTDIEHEKEELRERVERLEARNAELQRDFLVKEDELNHRIAEVSVKEQRVATIQAENTQKLESARRNLESQGAELNTLERDMKMRRVQLSEEHSQMQQWAMDLRTKEEEHEAYEKLMKDMQAVDERSRRHIKWQEDDLQRRLTEYRVAREDMAAESVQLQALRVQDEEDRAATEQMRKQLDAEKLTLERKQQHLTLLENELNIRKERIEEEEGEIKDTRTQLDEERARLTELENRCNQIRREAEIDTKRASLLRTKSKEQVQYNTDLQKKLQGREKELHAWDDELDWREAEFAHKIEAAMNLPREPPGMPQPSKLGGALVNLQMKRMQESYGAGHRRRVISAMQPHNRSGIGSVDRTCSPSYRQPESSHERELHAISAVSHSLELQEKVGILERDFRFFGGKLLQLQAYAPTEADKETMMAKHFTPHERATISVAMLREHDIGTEAALNALVAKSPMKNPSANPVAMVDRMQKWWDDLHRAMNRREENMLHERMETLTHAVDVLRRVVPLLTTGSKKENQVSRPTNQATNQHSAQTTTKNRSSISGSIML